MRTLKKAFSKHGSVELNLPDFIGSHALNRALDRSKHTKKEKEEVQPEPWFDEKGEVIWPSTRIATTKLFRSKVLDTGMTILVIANIGIIIYETDKEAMCYPRYAGNLDQCPTSAAQMPWLSIANLVLLIVYSLEAAGRMYAERCKYFHSFENVLDFSVCAAGWISEILGSLFSLAWLRLFRVVRLCRALRIVTAVPELYMLFMGFLGSIRAMLFGSLLLLSVLVFCSVLLVQYVHPTCVALDFPYCERCPRAYKSVMDSTLTLFQQIVAGDSWGLVSVPVIEEKPALGMMLPAALLLVGVGIMNLILAVVVDRAVEAREDNKEHKLKQKASDSRHRRGDLLMMFAELDGDGNGMLKQPELEAACLNNEKFQKLMMVADIDNEQLGILFQLLDVDGDGNVSYLEFCDVLDELQAADIRKTTVLNKYSTLRSFRVTERKLRRHQRLLEHQGEILEGLDQKLSRLLQSSVGHSPGNFRQGSLGMLPVPETPFNSARSCGEEHPNSARAQFHPIIQNRGDTGMSVTGSDEEDSPAMAVHFASKIFQDSKNTSQASKTPKSSAASSSIADSQSALCEMEFSGAPCSSSTNSIIADMHRQLITLNSSTQRKQEALLEELDCGHRKLLKCLKGLAEPMTSGSVNALQGVAAEVEEPPYGSSMRSYQSNGTSLPDKRGTQPLTLYEGGNAAENLRPRAPESLPVVLPIADLESAQGQPHGYELDAGPPRSPDCIEELGREDTGGRFTI